MIISYIWEHNGNDTLLYARDLPGAYARGASLEEALAKFPGEIRSYLRWTGEKGDVSTARFAMVQEKQSGLQICDADSEVLFESEKEPLTQAQYQPLKELVLRSAADFQRLFDSIPDPHRSVLPARETFYGMVPRTAEEMYEHTKNVNSYYFGEIGLEVGCEGAIRECRQRAFEKLEKAPDYLENRLRHGSYGEEWTLRKVLRRFIWHDRIHAKAMYRMAVQTFGAGENVFFFE